VHETVHTYGSVCQFNAAECNNYSTEDDHWKAAKRLKIQKEAICYFKIKKTS
jgi:hypothetical protein